MTPSNSAFDEHVAEERLVDLTLGETRSPEEERHLESCAECRALLTSLTRTLTVTKESSEVTLVDPPPAIWDRIEAEIGSGRPRRRDRRPAVRWLAAACAAGVLAGVGGAVIADRFREPETESARTIATAELGPLDSEEQRGSARVEERDGRIVLQVTADDVDAPEGYAEVWLINRDGERMVSVGVLEEDSRTVSFPISRALLDEGYVVVDISREDFDDDPTHSGDTVVRGSLSDGA